MVVSIILKQIIFTADNNWKYFLFASVCELNSVNVTGKYLYAERKKKVFSLSLSVSARKPAVLHYVEMPTAQRQQWLTVAPEPSIWKQQQQIPN